MRLEPCFSAPLALLAALLAAPAAAESTADATPTWAADVAPIVHRSCASCHRPGEVAPMSLLTYQEARPWAKSIRRAVSERAMPPWHADSSQVAYANDRSLSDAEVATLVRWVDSGAPAGDLETAPAPPTFTEGWRLGEPDLVFTVKQPFRVPVTDEEIPYQSLVFQADIPEDLYVEAWEIRTDAPRAMHHANLVRQPVPFEGGVGIAGAVIAGGDYVGSYLPGHNWVRYPEGTAYKLGGGSHLGIQVHYVSIGEEVEDTLQFGVHLASGRVDKLVRVIGTDYRAIEIPPGEKHYEIVDEITVLYDLLALSSGIHMHLRGAAYTMEAVRPDGEVALITEVPRYDFNWQSNYVLAEPVPMPEGTKLRVTSVWDNSADNPYNPDPTATVRYGPWTEDEMVNSWAHVVLAQEKLGLLLEDGRVVGRTEDAQETPHPFMIQTLPQAPSFQGAPGGKPSAGER
jgi:mono/diheme cytochrome c family protein